MKRAQVQTDANLVVKRVKKVEKRPSAKVTANVET